MVDNATFAMLLNQIIGLIGPYGLGKTTYFNCMAGAIHYTNKLQDIMKI